MDLGAYRVQAETFVAELGDEYHAHYAGLRDGFEVDAIYARHAALFAPAAVDALRVLTAAADDAAGVRDDEARRLRMLLDFAVEGCVGLATAPAAEAIAQREASLRLDVGGTMLGFRESSTVQANEPSRERRAEIEAVRLEATETQLNPLHREALARTRDVVRELGWSSYRALCSELKGYDLEALSDGTAQFLAATDAAYAGVVEPALARVVGVGLGDFARADLPWFFRARVDDDAFPAERPLEAYGATLAGLGLEPTAGGRIALDVEARPRKSPRAFCVPVRAPQDVRLVVAPVGGRDDYVALLHEGGHAQHYAHVEPALPFEFRQLGDNAVTEAFAFLFDHLTEDPRWLRRRLGVGSGGRGAAAGAGAAGSGSRGAVASTAAERDDDPLAVHARAARLVYLRRYCGKLAYESVAHGEAPPDDAALADVYSRSLSSAVGVAWPSATYLADLDPGFYVAAYLRAWALETHLRRWLEQRFGPDWFATPAAGELLRGLWADGQRLSAEELLHTLTGEQLDLAVLVADLGL
ncbi:hypothetical protein [Conexibacter sp. CPCC 206217]|uniref:hypothetical protein n=1 Tax=Conexibacter sp. CPCC 206217 TaxID=3064574 RepID=UPI002718FC21|nr:hypothetical protein [Conexibacter sp. CPCC 206217]MDO8213807.1 hypothetical protein [Conexibacter sp. CPCC 206217]